jgi:5'-nucleotidase
MAPGPLQPLLQRLGEIQQREWRAKDKNGDYERALKIAIITARNAPADARLVETLRAWGVQADETHFTGGIEKRRFLDVFRPHVFFDDQMAHLAGAALSVPSVHVPFGVANRASAASSGGDVPGGPRNDEATPER